MASERLPLSQQIPPSPWTLREDERVIVDAEGNPVLGLAPIRMRTATKRIAAAAPELLEALETLLLMADLSKCPAAEGEARAAIAKAKKGATP